MAYLTGATKDIKFAQEVKKDSFLWASFITPEVLTHGNSLNAVYALDASKYCTHWTTTFLRSDGEAKYDCY